MKTYGIRLTCGTVRVFAKRGLTKELATAVANDVKIALEHDEKMNNSVPVIVEVIEDEPIELDELDEYMAKIAKEEYEERFKPDYSSANPWDAPGMSVSDFI